MKKALLCLLINLPLAACGSHSTMATAPGAALPDGFAFCRNNDEGGRCTDWSSKQDQCVNPKGHDTKPMIVPCSSIPGYKAN